MRSRLPFQALVSSKGRCFSFFPRPLSAWFLLHFPFSRPSCVLFIVRLSFRTIAQLVACGTAVRLKEEIADFIKCQKCGIDGRMVKIFLTEKGLRCREPVESQWRKMETEFFANLTDTEKLIFRQVIEKITDTRTN